MNGITSRVSLNDLRTKVGLPPLPGRTALGPAFTDNNTPFNVKDFGAIGNGIANDTAAIQACLTAAGALVSIETPLITPVGTVAGALSGTTPLIEFPHGIYKITDELNFPNYCVVRSDGNARIVQHTAATDIFNFDGGVRVIVYGFTFLGGRHAIRFRNNNLDTGSLRVSHSEFHAQEDYAIRIGDHDAGGDASSTLAVISECGFYRPKRVLHTQADHCVFEDSWVFVSTSNFDADTAAFYNEGNLEFRNMFGVPLMNYLDPAPRPANLRWIDNAGNFVSHNSRFGGEGAGMAIIYHFTAPEVVFPWLNGGIIEIHGGYVAAGPGGDADSGVIHLATNIPQLLIVRGTAGIDGVPLINNSGGLTLSTYLAALPAQTLGNLRYVFEDDLSLAVTATPTELLPFFVKRLNAGLTFPTTAVLSTDAHTLDDYEEGTWSPVVAGSTGAGVYTAAVSFSATYQKVGNKVTVWCHFPVAAGAAEGGTGNVRISGLPFAISANSYTGFGAASVNGVAFTGSQLVVERITSTSTSTLFMYGLSNAGFRTEVPIAGVNANDVIDFEFSYLTDL